MRKNILATKSLQFITSESLLSIIKNHTQWKTKLSGEEAWIYTDKQLREIVKELITMIKTDQ